MIILIDYIVDWNDYFIRFWFWPIALNFVDFRGKIIFLHAWKYYYTLKLSLKKKKDEMIILIDYIVDWNTVNDPRLLEYSLIIWTTALKGGWYSVE
jgi:hypothetical protein